MNEFTYLIACAHFWWFIKKRVECRIEQLYNGINWSIKWCWVCFVVAFFSYSSNVNLEVCATRKCPTLYSTQQWNIFVCVQTELCPVVRINRFTLNTLKRAQIKVSSVRISIEDSIWIFSKKKIKTTKFKIWSD